MRNILEKAKNIQNGRSQSFSKINKKNTSSLSEKTQKILNKTYEKYTKKFEQTISPIVELSEDDSICAQVANESYNEPKLRKTRLGNFILNETLSTTDAAVYVDTTRQICVLWLRWTIITEFKDLSSDVQIVLDIQWIDPRVKNSLHAYDSCKRQYEHFSFRVCGHSLWGTLSYIVAKHREPNKCVVFNPGVSINTFFLQMLEDTIKKTTRTEQTTTYKMLGDIISTAAFVGHTKIFSGTSNDPLKLHAMDNFVTQKNKIDNPSTKDNV